MSERAVTVSTPDGTADGYLYAPEAGGPPVLLYMDAGGVRPDLRGMAERLASNGYTVLLPNLYYRSGPYAPFDATTVFTDEKEWERLMGMVRSLDHASVMRDTGAYLDFLDRQPGTGRKAGCVGYCMGGGFALSAAGTFPERVAAAASFHGARLATDAPDSPHRLAAKMRGEIYVGIAGIDPHFPEEEKQRLEAALDQGGVHSTVEVYPGVRHGFAVSGMPVYDGEAAELHWRRLLELFGRTLKGA